MLRKKYIEAIKNRVYDRVVVNYDRADKEKFVLGQAMFNYKCHINAVQRVKEGKAAKVLLCVTIGKNDWKNIIVHFINQLEDGRYEDNTWGYTHDECDYYIIKEVPEYEFHNIGTLLNVTKDDLVRSCSNAILRKLFRIKELL